MHRYVTDVEAVLLYNYKIDPYTMEQSMTIMDFQFMVRRLIKDVKEDEAAKDRALSGNKVAEALTAVRDLLNFISLPKTANERG